MAATLKDRRRELESIAKQMDEHYNAISKLAHKAGVLAGMIGYHNSRQFLSALSKNTTANVMVTRFVYDAVRAAIAREDRGET